MRTTPLLWAYWPLSSEARDGAQIAAIRRGGYVLADWDGAGAKRAVIIATGSEVALAMGARAALAEVDGPFARYRRWYAQFYA